MKAKYPKMSGKNTNTGLYKKQSLPMPPKKSKRDAQQDARKLAKALSS